MSSIAKIISAGFNPFVVIIIMSFLLTSFNWGFFTLAFVMIPAAIVKILVKKKIFSNFDVSVQKQRPLLYFILFTSALVYLSIAHFFHAPIVLIAQTLIILLVLITLFLVNKITKASGHMAFLSEAVMMLVFAYNNWIFLLGFIFVGVLAWSRLELKRHSLREVVTGATIGIILSALVAII